MKRTQKKIEEKLYDFNFTVGGKKVSDDRQTAQVQVEIEARDYSPIFMSLYKKLAADATAFGDKETATKTVVEKILAEEPVKEKRTMAVNLEMKDGAWVIPMQKNPELMSIIGSEGTIANILQKIEG